MKLSRYLQNAGLGAASHLAKEIGSWPANVSDYGNGKREVPVIHCVLIEKATGGQVTRRDLRPKDWKLIWPELAAQSKRVSP